MTLRAPRPVELDVVEPSFAGLLAPGAVLRHLADGCLWAEGPVYVPGRDVVLWSDIPNDRRLRCELTTGAVAVEAQPAFHPNGHTLHPSGDVLACEHSGRAVTRISADGTRTVLADRYRGKRLNSPNDVVVAPDGSIWFTDPTYGLDTDEMGRVADAEIGACHVYRLEPETGELTVQIDGSADDGLLQPNGIAFSPDARYLYVSDTGVSHVPGGPRHIRRFEVDLGRDPAAGCVTGGGAVWAKCPRGLFDGFRIDPAGRVWASGRAGVHCYTADGDLLGTVGLPETCANLEFGGADGRTLFMTATTSLYAVDLAFAARGY